MSNRNFVILCLIPLLVFSLAFLAFPLIQLFLASGQGDSGWNIYLDILRKPRYLNTLVLTVIVSLTPNSGHEVHLHGKRNLEGI